MRLSEAEWQIMKALWRCQPATVRDLIEHLPPGVDWAYTTVKTMLTRLEGQEGRQRAQDQERQRLRSAGLAADRPRQRMEHFPEPGI